MAITAGTTRTQAGATLITSDFTTVGTSTAATAGTNQGDGVLLPKVASGSDRIYLLNNTANPIVVYGNGSDTVNGNAGTVGIAMPAYAAATFIETDVGAWQAILDGEPDAAFNTNTATSSTTLTAANITGGSASVDLSLGSLSAAGNATLPTVANLVKSMWAAKVGDSYRLRIINTTGATNAWTVVTATGWTLTGTMSIAASTWREFVVTLTSLTAATLQSVAVGTYS